MVKPSVKKQAVKYLKKKYNTSVRSVCSLFKSTRAIWYYESKLDDSDVIAKLNAYVRDYPNRGFDNYYKRLRREGYKWARSRVLRVYRDLGLVRRPKKVARLPEGMRKPLTTANKLNEVWSMDFMSDSLEDGRKIRILNVIDDYNRESLLIQGGISMPSGRVIRLLEQLEEERGLPRYIRTDNGPEFRSKEYARWCEDKDVQPIYSSPGKPTENAYVERFNRLYREDILDAYLLNSLSQLNKISEKWREDYNYYHPHSSLGDKSPLEYARLENPQYGVLKPHIGSKKSVLFKL